VQIGEQYFFQCPVFSLRVDLQVKQVNTLSCLLVFSGFGTGGGFGLHASAILRNAIDSLLMHDFILLLHL
jgi:hypothetical protein